MTGNPAPLAEGREQGAPPEIDRMAVKIAHLDRLLGLTGEIIITASNISILQRHLSTVATSIDKSSMEMVKNAALTANRISSDLHHLVMDIRMVPIKDTFLRFRRLVRDLAKKKGRQVNFEIVGEDTLVDKTVAEKLYEPLAHQIRNAIDHGLEDPLERKHQGKDATGQLILTAYKKEGFTFVSVADDGQGLDESRIRHTAVEKGFLSPAAAQAINQAECWNLIMQPGFSTNTEATEISGRGVGMDVVKNTVETLGGEVIIETAPGKGSIFTYKIPQLSAVNITDALILRVGESFCAVPIGNVVATQSVETRDVITTMGATESIQYLGAIIPMHDLRALLSGSPLTENPETLAIIIIDAKNGRIALKVSEFIRPQKLVLIPLPEIFSVRGVSGTTILGGNQLGMVLDPFELIALATGRTVESGGDAPALFDLGPSEFESDAPPSALPSEEPAAAPDAAPDARLEKTRQDLDESVAEEFFIEIHNILSELNEDIFQLEKDPENARRVNTIFRHFHSIKGNFIMTGFTSVGAFVHEVETVLDRVREKELTVTQELIDLLLDVVKNLEAGLARIRGGQGYEVTDADLLAALATFHSPETKGETTTEEDAGTFHLSPLANILYYTKLISGQSRVFQSFIGLSRSFQDPSLAVYLVLKRLAEVADLMDTVPALDKIERGLAANRLKIMFSSNLSLAEMNRFFEKQLVRYYNVVEFENMLVD
ncbi:MAG: Hpt domain-containing protein [Candidatus Adiutrix sp.]|jgi:chemotaxis protein histidine kinase CheA|nr:Hpt domain-containing protein [Candidatus Adiutrix sp.]